MRKHALCEAWSNKPSMRNKFRFTTGLLSGKHGTALRAVALCSIFWVVWGGPSTAGSAPDPAEHPAFDEEMKTYKTTEASGAIAALQKRL